MSSLEKRLAVFRKLPLRAQLATITSTKANATLSKNQTYIDNLEEIHAQCLADASSQEQLAYNKAKELLE